MLKKIPTRDLRLGMHLHRLEGSWMDHPFWRTRFLLDDPADLKRLQECGVRECWIDVRLGADVAANAEPAAPTEPAAPAQPGSAPSRDEAAVAGAAEPAGPAASARPSSRPTAFLDEVKEAAAICDRGRDAMVRMFSEARLGRAVDTERCRELVEDVAASVERNAGALVSLARLKNKDDYTYMHSVAVCALMVALGRQLGMDEAKCREAGLAGLVHDVGKALMPPEVLGKPGKLTEEEWRIMRSHPERGHQLLEESGTAGAAALDVALHHHERIDGRGYPHRLAGDALSEVARMGAICDVYDAITSNRPYKAGWDPAESLARMASWTGHFDAGMFAAFVHSLGIYPTGSVVKLESGRLAIVAEQNAGALLTPVVVVFGTAGSHRPLESQRIDLSRPACSDRIVARAAEAAAHFGPLDALWLGPEVGRRSAS
jgi:HD-GYP domain-containing protein (c-di-GMP phosphodiesterase class II)